MIFYSVPTERNVNLLVSFQAWNASQHRSEEIKKEPYLGSKLPPCKTPLSSRDHQVSEGLVGLSYSRVTNIVKF